METLIVQYLAPIKVQRLLSVSTSPCKELEHYCSTQNIDYTSHITTEGSHIQQGLPSGRFDLAVVMDIEQLESETLYALLGTLKNVLSEKIWVLTPRNSRWQLMDFIALGFRQDPLPNSSSVNSYSYNLETYNHKRDWNNPRFWANPEQWHKRF